MQVKRKETSFLFRLKRRLTGIIQVKGKETGGVIHLKILMLIGIAEVKRAGKSTLIHPQMTLINIIEVKRAEASIPIHGMTLMDMKEVDIDIINILPPLGEILHEDES